MPSHLGFHYSFSRSACQYGRLSVALFKPLWYNIAEFANNGGNGMKRKAFWVWLALTALWIGVIFWHSSRVAEASDAESLGLLYYVQMILPWMTNNLLRKLGHFGEFTVLGVLMTGLFRQCKNFLLLKPVACAFFVCLCDETLQLFVPGRSGNVRDLWIDLGGVVFGALLLRLIFLLRDRKKKT